MAFHRLTAHIDYLHNPSLTQNQNDRKDITKLREKLKLLQISGDTILFFSQFLIKVLRGTQSYSINSQIPKC